MGWPDDARAKSLGTKIQPWAQITKKTSKKRVPVRNRAYDSIRKYAPAIHAIQFALDCYAIADKAQGISPKANAGCGVRLVKAVDAWLWEKERCWG